MFAALQRFPFPAGRCERQERESHPRRVVAPFPSPSPAARRTNELVFARPLGSGGWCGKGTVEAKLRRSASGGCRQRAATMATAATLCATAASASASSSALFPASLPSLRAYPRLLLAFRRPAVATVADPQGAVLEEEERKVQYDDDDGYEGGRGPAFTPATRPSTGKAALPLKRDRTRSKRFLEIQKLRESKKEYDVPTTISLTKQMSSARFVESAEGHFRMNLDPKYNDQQLRATVNLPKGTGQTVKIAVLTQGEKIDEATSVTYWDA